MKRSVWPVVVGLSLLAVSAAVYLIHYAVFHDWHHIFIYLVGDLAFLPIEVLLVTLILHGLLTHREKRSRLVKLNMVIGTFFSEVGTDLLKSFSAADPASDDIRRHLVVKKDWSGRDFQHAASSIRRHPVKLQVLPDRLQHVRDFLLAKRDFLLRLLENPNLLEHETFTDLLWAVFHLTDELARRADLASLPESDRQHLGGDMERAYGVLIAEWLAYVQHLRKAYPYLFSLAIRTNPFDPQASPVVT